MIWLSEDQEEAYTFHFPRAVRAALINALGQCKTAVRAREEGESSPVTEKIEDPEDGFDEDATSYVIGEEKIAMTSDFTDSVQGFSSDRTFVVMGSNIIVYRTSSDYDNALEYVATLPVVERYEERQDFAVKRAMLHDQEQSLLLLSKEGDTVRKVDLPTGKVVANYCVPGTESPLETITGLTKNAQKTGESQLIGLAEKALYVLDPRSQTSVAYKYA